MSKVKKDLLKEIDAKIARKKAIRAEVAKRKDDIEAYAIDLMGQLEDVSVAAVTTEFYDTILFMYSRAIEKGIKQNYDSDASVEVIWGDTAEGQPRRLTGILIKWSLEYQTANQCEPERYIDISSLLFR